MTGHCRDDEPLDLDWASLADPNTTLVVYMGLANLDQIVRELIAHGLPGDTPALAVCRGTTEWEQQLRSPLVRLPMMVRAASIGGPAVFIIGRVAGAAPCQSRQNYAAFERTLEVVA